MFSILAVRGCQSSSERCGKEEERAGTSPLRLPVKAARSPPASRSRGARARSRAESSASRRSRRRRDPLPLGQAGILDMQTRADAHKCARSPSPAHVRHVDMRVVLMHLLYSDGGADVLARAPARRGGIGRRRVQIHSFFHPSLPSLFGGSGASSS